jgi:hypothetical protein
MPTAPPPTPAPPAHIAVIGLPVTGRVLPSLGVVRELVARGHRVTCANDPAVGGLLAATGAAFVPYGSTLPVAGDDWPGDHDHADVARLLLADAVQMLPQVRAVYDEDPADVYLYDPGTHAARALAESQARPALRLPPGPGGPAFPAGEAGADDYRAAFAAWLARSGATTRDVEAFLAPPGGSVALEHASAAGGPGRAADLVERWLDRGIRRH